MAQQELTIGDVKIRPGRKESGSLVVTDRGDGSSLRLPLLVAAGKEPGPVLAVSGAVHGDEYEGPRAIQRFWKRVDPGSFKGVLIGVPVVNGPAYQAGKRKNPVDGVDMNRIFPGKENGTVSDMIAHCFFSQVVAKADCYVDLHAGGTNFAMTPTVVYLDTGSDEFRARELALAKAAGPATLWKGKGLWPAAHVAAVREGIPAILCEIGEEGRCSPSSVELGETVIANVMKHLGMMDGDLKSPPRWRIITGTYMLSRVGGCFYPAAGLLDKVEKGRVVGEIKDSWGRTIETVKAPYDGLIISTRTLPSLGPGEWTTFVGQELNALAD